jgi:Homeodomain-like domain
MASTEKSTTEQQDDAATRKREAQQRRAETVQMWRAGASVDEISRRLRVTRSLALRIIRAEVDGIIDEARPEDLRVLHTEALMDIWYALYPAAIEGNLEAVDRFLEVERRLATLQGLEPKPAPAPSAPPAAHD